MFEWADSEEHPGGRVASRQIVTADSASTGRSSKPDAHSSTERYAQRFSGRAGRYLLEVQNEITLRLLAPWPGASVLDVGGGHAQLAGPLAERGFRVTVLASDMSCLGRSRRILDGRVRFICGDLLDPPVAERSYDIAIAFRMLPHVLDSSKLISGLCRVARHVVVVDFPTFVSVNAFAPVAFNVKKRLEGNTRKFERFYRRDIRASFEQQGFNTTESFSQFFWPMVLHRMLKNPSVSLALESPPRILGLTRVFGSPVIMRATCICHESLSDPNQ